MQNQTAEVTWRSGNVPVSTRFDDPYFSLQNGLEETRHVFLKGNLLPDRFRDGFHIAELGFGTGLNFLATVQAWENAGVSGLLFFTSFEAYPLDRAQMSKALEAFSSAGLRVKELVENWNPEGGGFEVTPSVSLEVILGDARGTIKTWGGQADAWYLDGFSPAKNPELWSPALMGDVAARTGPGGSFATYTAAGFVRRGLAEAGFTVDRVPGFGRKRHMTRGTLKA
ncbi:MAG: tRNA (5-methylaminomethyl-2-thiouridine)(34)-methyltransferase MnmD [Pseudomonadota bacterium]